MKFQIITFYKFTKLTDLESIKIALLRAMSSHSVYGTFIIAEEGLNSTICGKPGDLNQFVGVVQKIVNTKFEFKSSFHDENVFKRRKVKIKKEIVTFKKNVDFEIGIGTHVPPQRWNEILSDPEVLVLDTRNDYEYRVGTFKGAVNPGTESFNDLPDFVENNLLPKNVEKIAVFCTGGIRCEKFAPYLKEKGFRNVYQLEGGILRYLEEVPEQESLWQGECFVFDERISVDGNIEKGNADDLSSEIKRKD